LTCENKAWQSQRRRISQYWIKLVTTAAVIKMNAILTVRGDRFAYFWLPLGSPSGS
jgi:hypothetical protein